MQRSSQPPFSVKQWFIAEKLVTGWGILWLSCSNLVLTLAADTNFEEPFFALTFLSELIKYSVRIRTGARDLSRNTRKNAYIFAITLIKLTQVNHYKDYLTDITRSVTYLCTRCRIVENTWDNCKFSCQDSRSRRVWCKDTQKDPDQGTGTCLDSLRFCLHSGLLLGS